MRLNSVNHSKPGANKSTNSYFPVIIQERLGQAINLTNHSTVFGHMQDPGVLFISNSRQNKCPYQAQGSEVQGEDKQGATQSDFTGADQATVSNMRQVKTPLPATFS